MHSTQLFTQRGRLAEVNSAHRPRSCGGSSASAGRLVAKLLPVAQRAAQGAEKRRVRELRDDGVPHCAYQQPPAAHLWAAPDGAPAPPLTASLLALASPSQRRRHKPCAKRCFWRQHPARAPPGSASRQRAAAARTQSPRVEGRARPRTAAQRLAGASRQQCTTRPQRARPAAVGQPLQSWSRSRPAGPSRRVAVSARRTRGSCGGGRRRRARGSKLQVGTTSLLRS
jgi:hypothetical protein